MNFSDESFSFVILIVAMLFTSGCSLLSNLCRRKGMTCMSIGEMSECTHQFWIYFPSLRPLSPPMP
jgi:hypothetical protein